MGTVTIQTIIAYWISIGYVYLTEKLKEIWNIDQNKQAILFFLLVFTSNLIIAFIVARKKPHDRNIKNAKFILEKIGMSFITSVSGIFTMFVFFDLIVENSNIHTITGLLFVFLFPIFLLLPTYLLYPRDVKITGNGEEGVVKLLFLITGVISPLFFFLKSFSLICTSTLKNLGFVDENAHVFSIKKSSYPQDMFPKSIWEHKNTENNERFYIVAVPLFYFGDNILLCPKVVVSKKEQYLKNNLDIFLASQQDKDALSDLRAAARNCALVERSKVTRWSTILEDAQQPVE